MNIEAEKDRDHMSEGEKIREKRIAVVGIGGVGGYLAGMLGRVCPHLTVAARVRKNV